jgi:drug/metabolite transporter, DME family
VASARTPGQPGPAAGGFGQGELFAGLAAMSYGSAYVATAFALRSFAPIPAAADRSILGAIALGAVLAVRRGRAPSNGGVGSPQARFGHLFVLGLLGGGLFLAGQSLAVAHVGATIAAFVAGLYAVLAAVLSPLILSERLGARALAGFLLALLGTALLAQLDLGGSDLVGIGWGLGAATAFAFFLVLARKWAHTDGLDGLTIAMATLVVAAIGLGGIAIASSPASLLPQTIVPEAAIAMVWLVFVAVAGQALTASSVRLIPASRSAAFLLLNPITATILAVALLGERPTGLQLGGAALVLVGIAVATIRR